MLAVGNLILMYQACHQAPDGRPTVLLARQGIQFCGALAEVAPSAEEFSDVILIFTKSINLLHDPGNTTRDLRPRRFMLV